METERKSQSGERRPIERERGSAKLPQKNLLILIVFPFVERERQVCEGGCQRTHGGERGSR
jgi:hypothetical protein